MVGTGGPTRWVTDRLSRRGVVAGLSGGSVFPWERLAALGPSVADALDVGAVGFVFSQSLLGNPVLGQAAAWLLVAYLVYAYVPALYPADLAVAGAPGFRGLTAAFAAFYGVAFGVTMGVVPAAFLPPAARGGRGSLAVVVGGLALGLVAFAAYFAVREESTLGAESDLFGVFAAFGVADADDYFARVAALDAPARQVVRASTVAGVAAVFLLPTLLLGLVGTVLNSFYPVPEFLLLLGLAGGFVRTHTRFGRALPTPATADVQRRAFDAVEGAARNLKGTVVLVYVVAGLLVSALAFAVGLTVVAGAAARVAGSLSPGTALTTVTAAVGAGAGVAPGTLLRLAGLGWFVVGLVVAVPGYGLYGMFYWLRQLERLPPYARYWEQVRRGERPPRVPAAPVARPPGLLVPANLLFVVLGALFVVGEPTPAAVAGFDLAWTALALVLAWTVRAARRRPPGHAADEGPAVLLALTGQVTLLVLALPELAVPTTADLGFVGLVVAVLVGVYYYPDVGLDADREGLAAHADVLYTGVLMAVVLAAVGAVLGRIPPFLAGALGLLLALLAATSYLDERVEVE